MNIEYQFTVGIFMIKSLMLEEFLEKNRIDAETWKSAKLDWALLQAIASDHEAQSANLESSAELFAKVIQKFNGVHSVRWRVKDSEHLAAKIVRKRAEENPKYADISIENYYERVTDLVGIRALHLFKENCFEIDTALTALWNPIEPTVAYIRVGDSEGMRRRFEDKGFEIKTHPAGYRSVHYIIESTPLKRRIIAEIQVRTIFEEGWSEIDHKIRYPNFSNNELVNYFLEIFNRMAGSADDMGGFVLGLVAALNSLEEEIKSTKSEKDKIFKEMEYALNQLESQKKQDNASKESIAKLKEEVLKLKNSQLNDVSINMPNYPISSFLGLDALTQAQKGLLGHSAFHQAKKSLQELSAFQQAQKDIAGLDALTQAQKGLLGHSAFQQAQKSLQEFSAFQQAQKGLLGLDAIKNKK